LIFEEIWYTKKHPTWAQKEIPSTKFLQNNTNNNNNITCKLIIEIAFVHARLAYERLDRVVSSDCFIGSPNGSIGGSCSHPIVSFTIQTPIVSIRACDMLLLAMDTTVDS